MLCLNLESTDPFFNLAVDEYFFKNKKENYLILGVNSSSVIIGKHQVAHREADTHFIYENKIPVIRRISGGGAVFHDGGNLNYSFITHSAGGRQVDFRKYTLPVIEFLASLSVDANFEGKNDLKVNGLKISGNAEHIKGERVLHHGTLLFDSQLSTLKDALRKDTGNYITKAVGSNPSAVINLKEIIQGINNIQEFKSKMFKFLLDQNPLNKKIILLPEDSTKIFKLAESKYRTWEWNYAYGPDYHFNRRISLNGEYYFCRFSVKDGIIIECRIEGSGEISASAKKMVGCRHMPEDIKNIFRKENLSFSDSDIFKFF